MGELKGRTLSWFGKGCPAVFTPQWLPTLNCFFRYWTLDINSLNSNFGSADDLKALASALHKRDMYLMVDVVINHMAATSNPPNYGGFSPFNTQTDFHTECFIQDSDYTNNQTAVEQCWLGDTNLPLADLNTEDSSVVSTWNSWVTNIVKTYSIDGLRIDTVKHIRKDFWPGFASAAGVYTVGEVLHNETSYVAPYTRTSRFIYLFGQLSKTKMTCNRPQRSSMPPWITLPGSSSLRHSSLPKAICPLLPPLFRLHNLPTRMESSLLGLSLRTMINPVSNPRLRINL